MAKTVEIPDELHDALVARAEEEGLSLSDYVVRELESTEQTGVAADLLERIRSRPPVDLKITAAELIREGREERDRELTDRWSSSTPRR
ncbi:MAG TPA: toxin-antitoxin system HicB family antitoxin [Thermoanaerobaculia bacterium]|jgi:hypothetical protein|nr:toxin-antitoxin system HicB family antitoxin [Thermoanaerobaculia bacterium]